VHGNQYNVLENRVLISLDFLRTGSEDREYSFADVFLSFYGLAVKRGSIALQKFFFYSFFYSFREQSLFFLFDFFSRSVSKIQWDMMSLIFRKFCKFWSKKCFCAFFVKSIGLIQLLQLSTDFDKIFRIYSPNDIVLIKQKY